MDLLFDTLYKSKHTSVIDENTQAEYIEEYKKIPVPTKKMESWKYFNPSPLFDSTYKIITATESNSTENKSILKDSYKLFFLNGIFQENISFTNSDFSVDSLKKLYKTDYPKFKAYFNATKMSEVGKLQSLNTCFAQSGLLITIEKTPDKPLELIFLNTVKENSISQIRNIIIAKANTEIKILETHLSEPQSSLFQNIATEILIGDNASIDYTILQDEAKADLHINTIKVNQSQNSRFKSHTLILNGGVVRNNIFVDQDGENCETTLNGIFFPSENEHFENNTKVNHNVPHCTTNEIYRGIAKDEATGVFTGEIYVAQGAQKTLANQSNKNIVLSDKASIFSKPQLIINADDVSCSHGSTTGQLDKEAIFYFMSRGINYDQAVKLLLDAFFADVTQNLNFEELYEYVEKGIKAKI